MGETYSIGHIQENTETYFLLADFRDVGQQLPSSRFAVFVYTRNIESPCQIPYLLLIASPQTVPKGLAKGVAFAYHPKCSNLFPISSHCLKTARVKAGKSPKARSWPGKSS